MHDGEMFLAKFISGIVSFDKFQNAVLLGDFPEELLKDIPSGIVDELVSLISPDALEKLVLRDKLRYWVKEKTVLRTLFSKVKSEVIYSLKSRVHIAFRDTTLGKGITLSQANALDNYQKDEDVFSARDNDKHFTWQNYPVAGLEKLTALLYLDEEAFVYYIPAYLCWCLDNGLNEPFSNISTSTFNAFDPDLSGFSTRVSSLNLSQKKVVKDFLWLFAVYSDIHRDTCISCLSIIDNCNFLNREIFMTEKTEGP